LSGFVYLHLENQVTTNRISELMVLKSGSSVCKILPTHNQNFRR